MIKIFWYKYLDVFHNFLYIVFDIVYIDLESRTHDPEISEDTNTMFKECTTD